MQLNFYKKAKNFLFVKIQTLFLINTHKLQFRILKFLPLYGIIKGVWRKECIMLRSATETIKKYNMLNPGDTVIVGLSGGADSMALMCFLFENKDILGIDLHAVHINHHIRGDEAERDSRFVCDFCREHGIKCTVFDFDVAGHASQNGLTVEEAGRLLRYKAFNDIATEYHSPKIATAHHLNDNTETVLHNILRGSGTTGLIGIHPQRGIYIRPLIETTRQEIEDYLNTKGIPWCTDKTNLEAVYTRNKIRLELLPYLRENFNSSIDSAITRLSALCREDEDFLRESTIAAFKDSTKRSDNGILLDRSEFIKLHTSIRRRLIRYILEHLGIPLKDVHMNHIDDCIRFITESQSGLRMKISSMHISSLQSGVLFSSTEPEVCDYCYSIRAGEELYIHEANATLICTKVDGYTRSSKNTVFISAASPDAVFEVRNRRNGDRIRPFGMRGTKKLKDYFIDNKIDISIRNKTPIIVYNNEVVWISGMCLSENYKITENTKNILKFELK